MGEGNDNNDGLREEEITPEVEAKRKARSERREARRKDEEEIRQLMEQENIKIIDEKVKYHPADRIFKNILQITNIHTHTHTIHIICITHYTITLYIPLHVAYTCTYYTLRTQHIFFIHTTYYILHTTYYILHTTYYILHTTYYILHTTYYNILASLSQWKG